MDLRGRLQTLGLSGLLWPIKDHSLKVDLNGPVVGLEDVVSLCRWA